MPSKHSGVPRLFRFAHAFFLLPVTPPQILAISLVSIGTQVFAGTSSAAGTIPAPPAARADSPDSRALDLFARGADAYKAGRFKESVDLLKEAYALKAEPILLYNLARAYEGLGQSAEALKAYTDYVEARPDTPDRGAIDARIASLRAQLDKEATLLAAKEQAEKEAKEAEERAKWGATTPVLAHNGRLPSPWPWVVAGVGGAGLVAGGVFGGLALAKHSAATTDPQTTFGADQSSASTFATAANVCFVAGGIAAAAGTLWGALDLVFSRKDGSSATGASPVIGPGWAGVVVRTP